MAYGSGYAGGYGDIIDTCSIPQGLFLDGTGDYASTPDSVLNSLQGTESILELGAYQATYIHTPGSADLAVTADLDLRWEGYLDSFIAGAPADQQFMVSNYNHNVAGFKLYTGSNITNLRFQASIAGNNAAAAGTHSLVPGTRIRIRVTRVFTTGLTTIFAGLATLDWLSLPSLPGAAVVHANTVIPNSATTMKIGSGEGAYAFSGRVDNASLVIGGTTVFNPDFSSSPWVIGDITAQARQDAAGKTWTLQGNAEIVALTERRSLRLSGVNGVYTSTPDNALVSLQGTAQGLAFSGDAAGTISAPDTVGLSVTGDFDVQFRLQPDVWNTPNQINLGGKYGAAGQRSWRVQINSAGRPTLEISSDGTATSFIGANATPTFTAGQAGWIRATWRASDGRVQFFTAPDATTPSWTQLGTDQTAAIGSIFDSTTPIQLIGNANLFPTTVRLLAFRFFAGLTETDTRANLNLTASPWVIGDQAGTARSDGINTWTIANTAEIIATAERRSLRLSGASTNASTPDSVGLSIVGDIDIRVQLAMDDWTPASTQSILGKFDTSNRSYRIDIQTGGLMQFYWTTDGNTDISKVSTAVIPFVDGAIGWIRVTLDVDNGATQNEVKFFTSSDDVTYTQLGATVTTAGVTSIFDGTAPLRIGAIFTGATQNYIGNIFKVDIRNNILNNGTGIVANPNFTARPWDNTESSGVTGADSVGNTWTLNSSGSIIQRAFANDLDIRIKVAMDDWTPATVQALISKRGASTSYQLRVEVTGSLTFAMSTNSAFVQFVNSGATGVGDGSVKWVRATMAVSTGVVTFLTSDDGDTWATLATSAASASRWAFYDSTDAVELGAGGVGTAFPMAGNIFEAEVRNGINGIVVANPDFQKRPWIVGATSGASATDDVGRVWTLNSSAIIQRAYASDIEVKIRLSMVDWSPAVNNTFVAKYDTNNQRAWRLFMDTSSRISWAYSSSGVNPLTLSFSLSPLLADGSIKWIKVTHDLGGGANNVKLYQSEDNYNWVLIQSLTAQNIFGFYDSTAPLSVGAFLISGSPAELLNGTVYYVDVRNDIDGTQVIAFNPGAPPWEVGDAAPTARPDMFGNIFTLFGDSVIVGPTGECGFNVSFCGGGYAGGQYATAVYAGAVPCSGQDYPNPIILSNVEEFCITSADC